MKRHSRIKRALLGLFVTGTLLLETALPTLAAGNEAAGNKAAGYQTDGSVIEISSEKDLLALAKNCKLNSYSLGKTVVLMEDIKVYSPNFKGIPFFNGTFQGNGHTISRLSISSKGSDLGFFRYLGSQAIVSDLTVTGQVDPTGSQENIGGIAGCNYGTITGCTFVGSVDGETNVGGIAGYNKSTGKILNSVSRSVVVGTSQTGGIAGSNDGLISGCTSESSVNVEELEPSLDLGGIDLGTLNLVKTAVNRTNVGGIAGESSGVVSGCVNQGTVGYAHSGYNVGGIAGSQKGVITWCENRGEVYGRKDIGGIAGQANPYMDLVYYKEHLSSVKDQISQLNDTVSGITPLLTDTSDQTLSYARTLVQQYRSMMDGIASDMSGLQQAMDSDLGAVEQKKDTIVNAKDSIVGILEKYRNLTFDGLVEREEIENFIQEFQTDMETLNKDMETIVEELKGIDGSLDGTLDAADQFMTNMSGQLQDPGRGDNINSMLDMLDENIGSMMDIMDETSRQINDIADSVESALKQDRNQLDTEEAFEDITRLKSAQDADGVITYCKNYGTIRGDLNAGGIAGSMNVDLEGDQETDADLSTLDIVVRVQVSSIVAYSANYGKVDAKKQHAGGIVGQQELGLIYGCESYGNVKAASGSYLGGIVGDSAAAVRKCCVRAKVLGTDYVGGVAGNGSTMASNLVMVTLDTSGEYVGAVAGHVEEDGSVVSNYYVAGDFGGIDDISYAGAAEGISYEEMMAKEEIPESFQRLKITFENEEGDILGETEVPYGGTLSEEDYPKVEPEEDSYVVWDCDKPLDRITDNLVVTAQNVTWTTSVAGNLLSEDGKDLFLAAGEFYEDTRLYLTETEGPGNLTKDAKVLYAYNWNMVSNTPKTQDVLEGHFYTANQADQAVLYLYRDGKWGKAKTEIDGTYLKADISYGTPFAVVIEPESSIWQYVLIAAAGAALLAVVIFLRYYSKKKQQKDRHQD